MMDDVQIRIVKALQQGLPLTARPFADVAQALGIPEADLLSVVRSWQESGIIRRFGAVLRHEAAGFTANAMGVWDVPDERVEDFGRRAAARDSISHCYRRPRFEGFPYNMYTMIHGRYRKDCEEIARELSSETGVTTYELLFTTAEYKKSAPVYFSDVEGQCT